jgi:hypothetical protein
MKISTGFYGNATRGLPTSSGIVTVFDATTGQPALIGLRRGMPVKMRCDNVARPTVDATIVIFALGHSRDRSEVAPFGSHVVES